MNPLSDYDPSRWFNITAGFITDNLGVDILLISILVVCLIFSAFFSSSETTLTTANTIRLRKMSEEKKVGARKAIILIENFDRTITTILIGNNLVNIGASTVSAFIFTRLINSDTIASFASTFFMTLIIITFGEILPKTYSKNNATTLAPKLASVLWFFYKFFYPLAIIFMGLQKLIRSKEEDNQTVTGEELETIIDTMEDEGIIDEDHADLIQSALTLSNKVVYDIMTPRVDMVAIEINDTVDEILHQFFDSQYSRLPVYEKDKDNILGILQEKDFLSEVIKAKDKNSIDIRDLITTPLYVTKATKVDDLIKEMQEVKKHFAIVSDEYGGTSGIVTMEDALEELVGEIYDEYDKDEDYPEVIDLGNNYYEVMPQTTIEDLYEYLDLTDMPEDSYGTIAGFVYELCEGLPEEGRKISVESVKTRFEGEKIVEDVYRLTYEILSVENRRIRKLKLLLEKAEEHKAELKDTKEETED